MAFSNGQASIAMILAFIGLPAFADNQKAFLTTGTVWRKQSAETWHCIGNIADYAGDNTFQGDNIKVVIGLTLDEIVAKLQAEVDGGGTVDDGEVRYFATTRTVVARTTQV